jgi:hypothetical protein
MPPRSASLSPARSNRCSTAIMSREVKRSSPFPVLPQRHQLGRGPHRAHHLVELVLAVAVPERELRQVAPRERRLLPRDRVQCDFRIGDDLLAILARDPGMVLDPLGLKPLFGHPRCRRPDLVLRLKVDPLRLQCAMVDPRINIELGKPLVDMIGPCLAPLLQQLRAVPLAHLLAEPLRPYLAHRQHDMRVRLGLAVLAHVPMHIEVRDHAAFDELLVHEIARELDALRLVQLARNRELNLAGKLRVLAFLAASTSFHKVARSFKRSGAPSGSMISEWTTPALFEKSWSRPSRSSCSSDAER